MRVPTKHVRLVPRDDNDVLPVILWWLIGCLLATIVHLIAVPVYDLLGYDYLTTVMLVGGGAETPWTMTQSEYYAMMTAQPLIPLTIAVGWYRCRGVHQ